MNLAGEFLGLMFSGIAITCIVLGLAMRHEAGLALFIGGLGFLIMPISILLIEYDRERGYQRYEVWREKLDNHFFNHYPMPKWAVKNWKERTRGN